MTKNPFPKLLLLVLFALTACAAPTPTATVTPTASRTPTPPPTETPTATLTPTPTPIAFAIEQLTAMSSADKLAMAPQAGTAPADVVASFLPKGADATGVTWGEKTLTYWERVVSYHGKVGEQEVTLYFDLESGQWAKKYESFESLSQIPAGQIPDVMVLGLGGDLGDRLIRNKLQYNYDWISQPQAMTEDGKQIFRDEKGYPKAVFDPATKTWLTPEQADVNVTWEKWKEFFDLPYVGKDGKTYNANWIFDKGRSRILTDPTEIENLPNATPMVILNPSGEITIWSGQKEAAQRAREGGIILVSLKGGETNHSQGWVGAKVAFDQYQKGNQSIYLTYNDSGVKKSEISGTFYPVIAINLDDIPKIYDSTGKILSPIVRIPKHFSSYYAVVGEMTPIPVNISNPDFWLDEIMKAGANDIHVFNTK